MHGDEPLLAQEAGDAIRAAARAAGYTERKVFTVSGAHFDWSGVLGAAQAMSLFADRQLIEIRIPSGKPGKDGSEALQRYCESLSDDVLTLVQLPRLDFQQIKAAWFTALDAAGVTVRVEPIERKALPAWIAQRLARQGQRVPGGEPGQRTLAFFADRVEGNLLAAHQELQKLGAAAPARRAAASSRSRPRCSTWRATTSSSSAKPCSPARWHGRCACWTACRPAARPRCWCTGRWPRTSVRLARVRAALDDGKPLPLALREARVWGLKEKLYERAAPQLAGHQLQHLLEAASICDGIVKGLRHPDWPTDAWAALQRLVLMLLQAVTGRARRAGTRAAGLTAPSAHRGRALLQVGRGRRAATLCSSSSSSARSAALRLSTAAASAAMMSCAACRASAAPSGVSITGCVRRSDCAAHARDEAAALQPFQPGRQVRRRHRQRARQLPRADAGVVVQQRQDRELHRPQRRRRRPALCRKTSSVVSRACASW